MCVLMFSA